MPTVETIAAFAATSLLLALAPGPDHMFVLTQSARYGARAGFLIILGLCTGLVGHSAAVAFSVSAILQDNPSAFIALRVFGVAYLLFLAYRALSAPARSPEHSEPAVWRYGLYLQGVAMNLANPKVALFFLVVFAQFTDPARGDLLLQIALLALVFIACTLLIFGLIAALAGTLRDTLRRSPATQRNLNRVAGAVFIILACWMISDVVTT